MGCFQKDCECLNRRSLARVQLSRLRSQVRHVWENVLYYRNKMEDAGVTPDDIKTLEDLQKLPFTTKDDLREAYPDGFLAVPKDRCVRLHSTSGTTGKRVIAYYTANDIEMWNCCVARALSAAGVGKGDIVQICYGFGLFTGGFGIEGGSEKVGCLTVPMSSGNTERQLQFLTDIKSTVIAATPSYAMFLSECIKERGLENDIHLKAGIFGAESWSEEMRRELEKRLGIKAYDIYGLTELSGPGVAYECSEQDGMHINEDFFIAETINPETKETVPYGNKGELVFTSLAKEAFPLIRYRTRDITILDDTPCACGRTFLKMHRPMGRSDDMLIVRGVNVFPSQIEAVLVKEGFPSNYQIEVDRVNNSDRLDLTVEMTHENFSDSLSKITALEKRLVASLKDMLGISVNVHLAAPGSIKVGEGKAVRVIDRRKF